MILPPRRAPGSRRLPITALLFGTAAVLSAAPAARAQFAVIDIASVTQLIQEVQSLTQQLTTLRAQLSQAQALYQSMTGNRGMQQLLSAGSANYLPTTWSQLIGAMQGLAGAYASLSSGIGAAVTSNAVLSNAQLANLSASNQALISASRQAVGLQQGLSEQALTNSSSRFNDVQQLAGAIGSTGDQKGILELQATIAAEQGLLQNEQTKLQVLFQAAQSQRWAAAERTRELIIASHGSFATRFEPSM